MIFPAHQESRTLAAAQLSSAETIGMTLRNFVILQGAFFLLTLAALGQTTPNPTPPAPANPLEELAKGIVVEEVDNRDSKAEKAGFQEGDILLNWVRGDARGEIESPFDLSQITIEEASRGVVRIEGLRGTGKRVWVLESDVWGVKVRPNFPDALLGIYREGRELARAGKLTDAAKRWRVAAVEVRKSHSLWLGSWLLFHSADLLASARQWNEADGYYQEAIEQARESGPVIRAQLFQEWAKTYQYRNDRVNADKYYQQALVENRQSGAETMGVAMSLSYLGLLALRQFDLAKAEQYYHQALMIQEKLAPGSFAFASSLNNLGIIAYERDNLAEAEAHYRQALAIEEKISPGSRNLASTLSDLGSLAKDRGDLAKAEEYQMQALMILEKLIPDSLVVANILTQLGDISLDQGDPAKAKQYYRQSLVITARLAPDSFDTAANLDSLGGLAQYQGDAGEAQEYYLRALEIREKQAPGSQYVALTFKELGDVMQIRGDLSKAEEYYRHALAIQEKLASVSRYHAATLAALAGVMRQKQQPGAAAQLFDQALDALENQTARLGGADDERSGFRARYESYYKDYIDLLITQQRPELAFQILERSRARTLLETLAMGHIDIHAGVTPDLLEQERSLQQSYTAKSNRRIQFLNNTHSQEQLTAIDKEINELLEKYQDVEGQIRASSPGYAALTQPQPLSAREIQKQLLDPGSLLLEYSLGEERSYVFAVTPNTLVAYRLPKRALIEGAARQVYSSLTARNSRKKGENFLEWQARVEKAEAEYPKAASELSRMVLGPVASELKGKRLLIVSDGALHYIPFAALPIPKASTAVSRPAVPLIVKHEIINLPSASVLSVLRQQRIGRERAPKAVAVLADPVFDDADVRLQRATDQEKGPNRMAMRGEESDEEDLSDGQLTRSAADVGLGTQGKVPFPRLPLTRQEADSIMTVTPAGEGMVALDFNASRATAVSKSLAQYRIVHFATHGILNSQHPQLSGLVLSLVNAKGRPQNGFLGLQDIYNLNLPAELVVLSACETGLGKEIQGEGLIGLTRGFMYAGASRVVASLWKIDDLATANLMGEFYKAMEQQAMPPAAALRQAQIEMWKQQRWHAPYYWAAFQIHGEWK